MIPAARLIDRAGRPINGWAEWGRLYSRPDYRFVRETWLSRARVVTIWAGAIYSPRGGLYETRWTLPDLTAPPRWRGLTMAPWPDYEAALAGHQAITAWLAGYLRLPGSRMITAETLDVLDRWFQAARSGLLSGLSRVRAKAPALLV